MLAADKLQLQSALKQQATALKEKEFNLHHSNLMTVGTQAAVLAGLDITMFIEFNPYPDDAWHPDLQWWSRFLKMLYYGIIVAAFCANMLVVAHTTALSVLGAGLALRGPDGSMPVATDVVYEERRTVFYVFGWGLLLTVGSVLVSVWILLQWEAALLCWILTLITCFKIYSNYRRISKRLHYNENDSVNFDDILSCGPAAIRVVPNNNNHHKNGKKGGGGSGGGGSGARSPRTKTRQFIKRSFSTPPDQDQNHNDGNCASSSGMSSAFSTKPSAHYYHKDDDEEEGGGGGYYHSYSSEEGDSSTMPLIGKNHLDGSNNMKQRMKRSHSPSVHQQQQQQQQQHHQNSSAQIQTV